MVFTVTPVWSENANALVCHSSKIVAYVFRPAAV
jgi:hypothetical protein